MPSLVTLAFDLRHPSDDTKHAISTMALVLFILLVTGSLGGGARAIYERGRIENGRVTMNILGLTPRFASNGKELADGSVALAENGHLLYAIAEERLARAKRVSGWRLAAEYCLDAAGLRGRDIDVLAISTCTDSLSATLPESRQLDWLFPKAKLIRVGHHLSHALYAYDTSPFDRRLSSLSLMLAGTRVGIATNSGGR